MARYHRRNQPDDLIEDMVVDGVLIAGLIAVAIGVAIADLLRTPTEEKLRRLTPQERWGGLISSRSCPQCRTMTEAEAGHCLTCGHRLL